MTTREIIQQSLDYIEHNIKAEITVRELCDSAGYSYVHYRRLFSKLVGMTPTEYINRRKLLHAVYSINNGSKSIDTALDFGFLTYAGFYKAFYREFNCSPSEFKKTNRGLKPYRINILQEEHILISKNTIKPILKNWNLQDSDISNIYNTNTGKQNENAYYIGDKYIIKFSADLGRIKKNIEISELLIKYDFPSARIIKTENNANYVQSGELYYIIQSRLKGTPLKCEEIFLNQDIAFQTGVWIAKLHNVLQEFVAEDINDTDIFNSVKNTVLPNDSFTEDYKKRISDLHDKLPQQIIHRDINPSNILFDNGIFSGFVDFDLTEKNFRITDICYFSTSVLSECFANKAIDKNDWTYIFEKIIKGYNSINPLSEYEKQAIPYVVYSIQLNCINYFSKFDKYQELTNTNIAMLKFIIDKFK